jgi:undecaprenyl-diphosphatase
VQPEKENLPHGFGEPDHVTQNEHTKPAGQNQQSGIPAAGAAVASQIQQEVQVARRPWYYVLRQARFLLIIYIIGLALIGALAFWVHVHPVLGVDVAITREFQESHTPWLETFMVAVSFLGNTDWVFIPLIVLTAVAFWALRLRLEAVTILVVNLTSAILNVGIKLLVDRPRPSAPLIEIFQHATGNSFPSGHVMSYVAYWSLLFTFSIMLFRGWRWWKIVILVISGLFIVLVGPSRIYLGDHWASDVLGAYLIGGLWVWFCLWVYTGLKARGVLAYTRSK